MDGLLGMAQWARGENKIRNGCLHKCASTVSQLLRTLKKTIYIIYIYMLSFSDRPKIVLQVVS